VSSGQHPDANLLSAFAEGLLRDSERSTVVEHLAGCGDCRNVVSLALPPVETTQTDSLHVRGRWFTWPALRWGFALAGIAAIATLSVVQYRQKTSTVTTAMRVPAPIAASEDKKAIPAAAPSPSGSATESTGQKASSQAFLKLRNDVASKEIKADEDQAIASPVPSHSFQRKVSGGPLAQSAMKNVPTAQAQQQVQSDSLSRMVAKQESAPVGGVSVPPAAKQVIEVDGAAAQLDSRSESANYATTLKVDKAKPAASQAEATRSQPAAPAPPAAAGAMVAPETMQLVSAGSGSLPRWTINTAGVLQRSFDGGATWQDVSVYATGGLVNSAISAETVTIREKDAAKKVAKTQAGPQFRTLAVNGAEVWAGGSNAALFHTSDAGAVWTRVVPSDRGAFLTGDILSISFPDSQHGRVATSTNEVWSTDDSGQTWRKH